MITKVVKGKDSRSLKFQIKGDFDVALINAIRRISIANLSIYCFSRNTIEFKINQTHNHDFLSMRFSLLPLNTTEFQKMEEMPGFELEKVSAELNVSNESEISGDFKSVYSDDFHIYSGDDKTLLDTSKLITIPKILLLKLKPGERISCSIGVIKGTHKENGGMFSPVSKCLYYFEPDVTELSKMERSILDKEKIYLKNKSGNPSIYNYEIETDGQLPVEDIFSMACDYAVELIRSKQDEIKKIDVSSNVSIKTSPTNMQGYDFIFEDSDDTLGNLIQTFGLKDKDIKYIGYNIPHILDKKLFIRISLGDDISRSIYEKKVIDIGNEIIKSIQKLKKEYIDAV
jgi:DNA-directed RNA polymerase subunit L/DNA-directed RNA polymerase alpha subunit